MTLALSSTGFGNDRILIDRRSILSRLFSQLEQPRNIRVEEIGQDLSEAPFLIFVHPIYSLTFEICILRLSRSTLSFHLSGERHRRVGYMPCTTPHCGTVRL